MSTPSPVVRGGHGRGKAALACRVLSALLLAVLFGGCGGQHRDDRSTAFDRSTLDGVAGDHVARPVPGAEGRLAAGGVIRAEEAPRGLHGRREPSVARRARPPEQPLFREVTESHLPTSDLEGLSMDAGVGDLDGDGDLDLVVANEHRPNILLLNQGGGRFRNASDRIPQAAHDSEDVGIADFDGDGDLDVVVVSEDDRVNELYLNRGDARFDAAGSRLPVTGTSNAVVTPDLNDDGSPDILIGNDGQNVALVNQGKARFRDETGERLPGVLDVTQDVEMGDADGDGDLDVIVGNEDDNRLLVNDGSGTFSDGSEARIPLRDAPEETREADFGDVDGDGDLDVLFANIRGFVEGADPRNRLLVNRGDGHFRDETAKRLPAHRDRSFDGDFVDVDDDGDPDIVTSNSKVNLEKGRIEDAPYRVYLNEGNGRYRTATDEVFPAGVIGTGFDVEAADLDGDGRLDLYMASRGSVDRLLLGRETESAGGRARRRR